MKKLISTNQMTFAAGTLIIASSLLTKSLYSNLKREAWIGVLLGFLISMPVMNIYQALAKRFPSMSLIEIDDMVFGRVFGKMVSALYIFYFMTLAFLNTRELGMFVKSIILQNTPLAIVLIFFISVCSMAVQKGAGNLVSYGPLFMFMTIAALIFYSLFLYKNFHYENFLPIFNMPVKNYLIGGHIVAALPFCQIFVLFMLFPYMHKPAEFGKSLKRGLVIGSVLLFCITVRDIGAVGYYLRVTTMPSFSVLRLIDVAEIFTRMEMIYAALLICLYFFKVSVIYFAAISGFSRLMQFDSYHFLVHIFGALIIVSAFSVFQSNLENVQWLNSAAPIYSTFFLFLLPAVTLATAMARKLTCKE